MLHDVSDPRTLFLPRIVQIRRRKDCTWSKLLHLVVYLAGQGTIDVV